MIKKLAVSDIIELIDDDPAVITVTINNLAWDVYLKDQTTFRQRSGMEDVIFYGITVREREEIWIWDGIRTNERLYSTIKHELVHAFVDSHGFGQFNGFSEENLADFIENYGDKIVELAQTIYKAIIKAKKKR